MLCNGWGCTDRQFRPYIKLFPKKFIITFCVVSAGHLVINCTFGITNNYCSNSCFNALTLVNLVCLYLGVDLTPQLTALELRTIEHACWIVDILDFWDEPAVIIPVSWCNLDRNTRNVLRYFGVKIPSQMKAAIAAPQWEFSVLWLVKIHSRLLLEVKETTGCNRVLGEGVGVTEHGWGC